jgi:hypothetical protein
MKKSINSLITIAIGLVLPLSALAAGDGTLIVEQKNTEYLGTWGLATPTGVVESAGKLYNETKVAGNYALTVKPPAGAVPRIEVFVDDKLEETFESRTANGILASGATLRFNIRYTFSLMGDVAVMSVPSGIPFDLKGPRGKESGKTPMIFNNVPEGTYTVYYKLPKTCRPALPISRALKASDSSTQSRRVVFTSEFFCTALDGNDDDKDPEPEPEPEPDERPPRRTVTQSPVRVSLSTSSAEVTAGGNARLNIVVLNRGDSELKDLTVEYRYDGSKMNVDGVRDGGQTNAGVVKWTVTIPANGKWDTSFSGKVSAGTANGTSVPSSVTVSGDDLDGVRTSQRSDSAVFGVIKEMPKTGVPLDIFVLFGVAMSSLLIIGTEGLRSVFVR